MSPDEYSVLVQRISQEISNVKKEIQEILSSSEFDKQMLSLLRQLDEEDKGLQRGPKAGSRPTEHSDSLDHFWSNDKTTATRINSLNERVFHLQKILDLLHPCSACNGMGTVRVHTSQDESHLQKCSICNGSLKTHDQPRTTSGKIMQEWEVDALESPSK